VTASGFSVQNAIMTYAFIAIIITSLGSIILAVMAVRPREKEALIDKEHIVDYSSLLYYQDMARRKPPEYLDDSKKTLKSSKKVTKEMLQHLHIIGSELQRKYFWLKRAYTFFSVGLVMSAVLIIYAMLYVEQTAFYNLSNGNVVYKKDKFYNIFEPSGAVTLRDGKVLLVEDEASSHALKLVEVQKSGHISELSELYIPKHIRKAFKNDIEDVEALASNGQGRIFAITSFTKSRTGKEKASRQKLMMFHYDGGDIQDLHLYNTLKSDLVKNFPKLCGAHFILSQNSNIEGLVYNPKEKILYLGFRAPLEKRQAMLIGIKNITAVFTQHEKPEFTKPLFIDLNGLGIRDITYDSQKNGYWIIAGESVKRSGSFKLYFYDIAHKKAKLVKNHPDIGFAEGITLINQASENPALFIVEDDGKKPNKPADYLLIDAKSLE